MDNNLFIFEVNRRDGIRPYENVAATLTAQMGTGGNNVPLLFETKAMLEEDWIEKETKNALRATGGQTNHVVFAIQATVIGRQDHNGPNGKGFTEEGPMYTLERISTHAVAQKNQVRRLTPVECERLQGFPDNWTDEQADTHRYKQMGNAVAVPVVQWIIGRMVE